MSTIKILSIIDMIIGTMVRKLYIYNTPKKVFNAMSVETKKAESRVSVPFQLALILVSIVLLSVIYGKKLNTLSTVETIVPLHDYNPESLMQFGSFYTLITTGLSIDQYEVFDVINNNFIIAATLWFLVDPAVVDIATLGKFSFSQGNLLYTSTPAISLENNKLLVQYRIRLQYSASLSYIYFPLDEHKIAIRLTNTVLTPQEAIFVSEYRYFNITASAKEFGWGKFDQYISYGYRKNSFDSAKNARTNYDPCVDFIVDFKRTSYRYIISIIFPMLTFFYLALFGFSTIGSSRFYLPTVGLTALISFRFIIDRLSPTVGYFMLSDYLFFIFLGAIFISFIFLLIDDFATEIKLLYKKIFIIVLHFMVISLNIYFVL